MSMKNAVLWAKCYGRVYIFFLVIPISGLYSHALINIGVFVSGSGGWRWRWPQKSLLEVGVSTIPSGFCGHPCNWAGAVAQALTTFELHLPASDFFEDQEGQYMTTDLFSSSKKFVGYKMETYILRYMSMFSLIKLFTTLCWNYFHFMELLPKKSGKKRYVSWCPWKLLGWVGFVAMCCSRLVSLNVCRTGWLPGVYLPLSNFIPPLNKPCEHLDYRSTNLVILTIS